VGTYDKGGRPPEGLEKKAADFQFGLNLKAITVEAAVDTPGEGEGEFRGNGILRAKVKRAPKSSISQDKE